MEEKKLFEDQEIIDSMKIAAGNFKLFKKILKKYGIIKNGEKLSEEYVNMLEEIKLSKETNNKPWEETIVSKIKEKYPDLQMNNDNNENESAIKDLQAVTIEIQSKYKEIDKLKEKAITLIQKIK